jgi:DNA-binding transcriptional ArsR family regulator
VRVFSEKPGMDPERARAMQERARERRLIVQGMKDGGSMTVEELSKVTGIEKSRVLRHLIAMRQFGKVLIVGERDDQFVYGLPGEKS